MLLCMFYPVEADEGVLVENMWGNTNPGKLTSCICKLVLTPSPRPRNTYQKYHSFVQTSVSVISYGITWMKLLWSLQATSSVNAKSVSMACYDCLYEKHTSETGSRWCHWPDSPYIVPILTVVIHPAKSSPLYLLWMDSQWKDRHGFHKQFIPNCRKIGCRS